MSAFFKQSWVRNAVTVMKKCAEDFEFDGTVDVGSYSTVCAAPMRRNAAFVFFFFSYASFV